MVKKTFIGLLVGLMMILGVGSALAYTESAELVLPAASATLAGAPYTFSCEANGTNDDLNFTSMNLSYSVDSGATWIYLGGNATHSGNKSLSNWSLAFNIDDNFFDNETYVFNCTVFNESNGGIYTDTSTSVGIDETVPTVSWVYPASDNVELGSTGQLNFLVYNATPSSTHYLEIAGNTYTLTANDGNNYTYTLGNTVPDGAYSAYVTVTDGTNTTRSSDRTIIVDVTESAGGAYIPGGVGDPTTGGGVDDTEQTQDLKTFLVIALVVAAVILFLRKKN